MEGQLRGRKVQVRKDLFGFLADDANQPVFEAVFGYAAT